MAASGSAALGMILEKIVSKDKDFRYMATSDLLAELSKETFRAAPQVEKKVCDVVIKQLDDQARRRLAIKCLPPLVKGASERAAEDVIGALLGKLTSGDPRQRDVGAIGLKTVVADLGSHPAAPRVVAALAPKLTAHVASSTGGDDKPSDRPSNGGASASFKNDASGECLDILIALAGGYGPLMIPHHASLTAALFAYLDESGRASGLRKRAATCLAALTGAMSDANLASTAATANQKLASDSGESIAEAASPAKHADTALYVQLLGAAAKAAGYRFGRHAAAARPAVAALCRAASDERSEPLREACLHTLELFASRCPSDAAESSDVVDLALELLSYDPNCASDDEDDEEMEVDEEEEEEDDDEDDDEAYSDDDDASWKVRRASAKLLAATLVSSPAVLEATFERTVPRLLSRPAREREESVKLDVFATLEDVVRACSRTPALTALAAGAVPAVVAAAVRQIKARRSSPKTKTAAFALLREVASSLPGALEASFAAVVPPLARALSGDGEKAAGGSALRVEALVFTRLVLASHPPGAFVGHVDALAPPVFDAARDRYYKVAAEALRACSAFVPVLRGPEEGGAVAAGGTHVDSLLDVALTRTAAADQDQEVKEAAITCLGVAVAALCDVVKADALGRALELLLERLANETTRPAAVKAIAAVANSPRRPDLTAVAPRAARELASFLRKANRPLRQSSLVALDALVTRHAEALTDGEAAAAVAEAAALVDDGDMALASGALSVAASVSRLASRFPGGASEACDAVLPAALSLVRSPLTHAGQALASLQAFFAALVAAKLPGATFEALLARLMDHEAMAASSGGGAGLIAVGRAAAKCVAAVCASVGAEAVASTVGTLVAELKSDQGGGNVKLLALLCLGELGRRADLSGEAAADLEKVLLASFEVTGEELRAAASFALGGVAAGNQPRFLPVILDGIAADPKHQYSLLLSLREVIHAVAEAEEGIPSTSGGGSNPGGGGGVIPLSAADLDKVLGILFGHAGAPEEGVRNVVSECLGRLTAMDPARLVPELRARADPAAHSGAAPETRITAITAVKYAVLAVTAMNDDERARRSTGTLREGLPAFVGIAPLEDEDRGVQRAAVQTLSAVAHASAALVAPLLGDVLPVLLRRTEIIKDLVRVVDLGPFKHTVDDGLDLRKAAFECLDTLLDACLAPRGSRADAPGAAQLELLDAAPGYLAALSSGLGDHYDIKMVAHLSIVKLCPAAGPAVLAVLDTLVEPMGKTLTAKLKSDAVKQEIDRNEDLLRSCLRAVLAMEKLEGAGDNEAFAKFLETKVRSEKIAPKYDAIKAEAKAGGVTGDDY